MKPSNIILVLATLMSMSSCRQKPSVMLSPIAEEIVNLFISSALDDESGNTIIIEVDNQHQNIVRLHIDAPPAKCAPTGTYCGFTYCGEHRVEVWGECADGLLWETRTVPQTIVADSFMQPIIYDPCDWFIAIDLTDTTLAPLFCYAPCGFPFSIDSLATVLSTKKQIGNL